MGSHLAVEQRGSPILAVRIIEEDRSAVYGMAPGTRFKTERFWLWNAFHDRERSVIERGQLPPAFPR